MATQPPLTTTFGVLGNIISVMVYLAPVPTFYRICKKKSTDGFHSLPYLVALLSAMLWLYYAFLKKDATLLITINSFGCVIETIYISLYIAYASKDVRNLTIKIFGLMNMGLFSLILFIIQILVKSSVRVEVFGWICVAISVSVFAAPLSIVAKVIRTRSVEFMPFNLSFFLTLSAIMWFAYGFSQRDMCIALPNILGFFLGLVQMVLYACYRKTKRVVEEDHKLPETIKNKVTILSTLGTSDVHPVDANKSSNANGNHVEEDAKEHQQVEDHGHDKSIDISCVV